MFFREPGSLFWTFGFPLLITVALGIAFRNQGPTKSRVVVVEGQGSLAIAAALRTEPGLELESADAAEADRQLRAGEVVLAVGGGAHGQPLVYRYDPSRPDALAARRLADDSLQRQAGRRDPRPSRDETAVARGARYVDWLVPGLLGMQLLNGAMWGAAFNIVNARQRKLLKRLAATPMRRGHYLLSYRISGLLFVPLQVLVLFAFARLTFGVVIQGSVVATLAIALLGSWSFAGLGLLCASRAQNSETANGLINLITLPMMVLSGVFFSVEPLPGPAAAGDSAAPAQRVQRGAAPRRQRRRVDLLAGVSDRRARGLDAGHVRPRGAPVPLDHLSAEAGTHRWPTRWSGTACSSPSRRSITTSFRS